MTKEKARYLFWSVLLVLMAAVIFAYPRFAAAVC